MNANRYSKHLKFAFLLAVIALIYILIDPAIVFRGMGLLSESIDETGECFHGNTDGSIGNLKHMIAQNQKEIESLRQDSRSARSLLSDLEKQKRITHLKRVNVHFRNLLQLNIDTCSFF